MKYLLVVAHPDDEVLGAGASIWKWCKNGDTVDVAIMCTEAKARAFRPDDKELEDDTHNAIKSLGVNRIYEATFPNIEMNTVPHLKLVQFIESAIKESEPDIVITHHPADTNNDHMQTSMACQEAVRLFQRSPEVKRGKEFCSRVGCVLILTLVRQSTSPVWQQCEEDNGVATMQRALKPFFVYIKNRQKVLLVVYEPNL